MEQQSWRERRMYPFIGLISIITILYLNFGENLRSPAILWQPKMGFVARNSSRFVIVDGDRESEVYVNGWNSYWLMEESVWTESRVRVSEMLRRGSEMGMSVCRTWAFNDGVVDNGLQISPGVFDERVFQGLDFLIVEARKYGIRLILSLVNNLNAFGGKAQYVRWAQEAGVNVSSSTDAFFSDPTIKGYYMDYVKTIVTRKNSISGVRYSEEPAIFAWELMNEPRCESSSSAPILQTWISEMAAYIKNLDRKHLVTVGLEGFYGPETAKKVGVNPGEWAALLGSDFLRNFAINDIDFASVHAYPDSWIPGANLEARTSYLSKWVDSHISDAEQVLKKPVLFTEIGSRMLDKAQDLYDDNILLKTVYDKIYESAKKREAGSGALIWQLLVEGMEDYGDKFSLVAWDHPAIYKLITHQSCRLQSVSVGNSTSKNDLCFA